MEFPDQLPIATRDRPIAALVRPPGSKSLTNRALICAALATGVSRLANPLEADDTAAMRVGLTALGTAMDDSDDPWLVQGTRGRLSVPSEPIDAKLSGTTARFLTAVAALVPGSVTITGQGRMLERPMGELFEALAGVGIQTEGRDGRLPVTVHGTDKLRGGQVHVNSARSSQFA